jgi:GNAT superfamily N-acetyltransferase
MLDQWFRPLHLPMSVEQFRLLPRHSAFKYEYHDGQAWLSPHPRMFNGLLDLTHFSPRDTSQVQNSQLVIRPLEADDWPRLPKLFAAAFESVPPFSALCDKDRLTASSQCLHQAHSGGDGPILDKACFVAEVGPGKLAGAVIVTLIPKREEGDWWDGCWASLPATDAARHLFGRPHLTWVFVAPLLARHGVGSALLERAVAGLTAQGYAELASTFLMGNDSTMLWHWRNGFRLMAHPGSFRAKNKPET